MHGGIKPSGLALNDQEQAFERALLKPGFQPLIGARANLPDSNRLRSIAGKMSGGEEEVGGTVALDSRTLPCAYTYFGQLLSHDITSHRFMGDVPPTLRLNTLYGLGASSSPHIYQHSKDPASGYAFRGVKFFLDTYKLSENGQTVVYDVPRRNLNHGEGAPVRQEAPPNMADARNDQNFILSQLSVAFMRRHNQLADSFRQRGKLSGPLFKETSRALAHNYQRIILTDYLPRVLWGDGRKTLRELAANRDNFLIFSGKFGHCRLSEIFARAAMRFGHTQVRQVYQVRDGRGLVHLFSEGAGTDLRGFVRDVRRKIDWQCLLYEGKDKYGSHRIFQPAKSLDSDIVLSLGNLRFLAVQKRDLIKSNLDNSISNFAGGWAFFDAYLNELQHLERHSPQEAALLNGLNIQVPNRPNLASLETLIDTLNARARQLNVENPDSKDPNQGGIPLWLFLLLEAEVFGGGATLGPLGSRIVAEQIMWVLLDDRDSVLPRLRPGGPVEADYDAIEQLDLKTFFRDIEPAAAEEPNELVRLQRLVAENEDFVERSRFIYVGDEEGFEWLPGNGKTPLQNAQAEPSTSLEHLKFIGDSSNGSLVDRTRILNNGFHMFPTDALDENELRAAIESNTLLADPKRKRQIRTYFSRKMILRHLLSKQALEIEMARTANSDDFPIRGLFFIPAIRIVGGVKKIVVLARPAGRNGVVAPVAPWLDTSTNTIWPATQNGLKEMLDNFIVDQFELVQQEGIQENAAPAQNYYYPEISADQLLDLLEYPLPNRPANKVLQLHLILATGGQIAAAEQFSLAEVDPDEGDITDIPFFGFVLSSDAVANGPGRPYPPYCYSRASADTTWK